MSEFHFNFKAVEGLPIDEGVVALFKQLEDHYNANMQPQPLVFGASVPTDRIASAQARIDGANAKIADAGLKQLDIVKQKMSPDIIRVKPDYEIKQGSDLGLKDGYILTGVNDKNVEIFDYLKNYTEGDTVVEGDSGKYDLGKAK